MKLKGEMVIELTDTNTGAVETVQETNMITEAVNNILGLNPMGIYLKASGEYDNSVLWNGTLLPICPNMIGGILLFPAVLEEKADHIYEQGKNLPVSYASNNVNSGSNVARGSLNQTESKKLDNGYKFVWEFTPSQGNGNIAAVALTSALGGQNAFGSAAGDASTFLLLKKVDIGDIPKAKQMTLFEAVELDFEKNLLYSITFGTSSVTITKIRIPVFNIGLNEKLDDTTTVYTIDLLGCGRSEKPDITYTNFVFAQLLCDFAKNVIREETDVIASGFSGSFAIMAYRNNSDHFRKIMLVNPPSFSSLKQAPCKDNKLFKYFIELPIFGTLIYHMVASRESISSLFMEKLFYNPFHVTDTLVDTYYESAHKGGSNAKYLYSSYIGKYLNISINNAVESSDACIYIISGEKEASASLIAEEYQKLNSSIETAVIPETRHLPHLEDPEHFLEQVAIFL